MKEFISAEQFLLFGIKVDFENETLYLGNPSNTIITYKMHSNALGEYKSVSLFLQSTQQCLTTIHKPGLHFYAGSENMFFVGQIFIAISELIHNVETLAR